MAGVALAVPLQAIQQFQVESDELEVFNKEGRAVFSGNVRVWNDTGSIESNRLRVHFVTGGDTIQSLEAFGNVKIRRQDLRARSHYAFFDVQSDTLYLQEDAYVRRNQNEFWSDEIWLNMREQSVRLKNNVRGTLTGELGQVTDDT